jgi:hypothetical protein
VEETELQEIQTRDDERVDPGRIRALLGFGVPLFVAGVVLVVRGVQDWGAPAVVAGAVLGMLGLAIAVIAISLSGSRG